MIGKWINFTEEEYYVTGCITAQVSVECFLVRIRPPKKCPPYSRLFHAMELTGDHCVIFDTEIELDAWTTWMDDPEDESSKPRLVKFNAKTARTEIE